MPYWSPMVCLFVPLLASCACCACCACCADRAQTQTRLVILTTTMLILDMYIGSSQQGTANREYLCIYNIYTHIYIYIYIVISCYALWLHTVTIVCYYYLLLLIIIMISMGRARARPHPMCWVLFEGPWADGHPGTSDGRPRGPRTCGPAGPGARARPVNNIE